MSPNKPKKANKPVVRTRTPRPDELTRDAFEFISAIDEYKRKHMRSFLDDAEILDVLFELGYVSPEGLEHPTDDQLAAFADIRQRYRKEQGRLFPTWSEVYDLLTQLGYRRRIEDRAA